MDRSVRRSVCDPVHRSLADPACVDARPGARFAGRLGVRLETSRASAALRLLSRPPSRREASEPEADDLRPVTQSPVSRSVGGRPGHRLATSARTAGAREHDIEHPRVAAQLAGRDGLLDPERTGGEADDDIRVGDQDRLGQVA